MLSAVQTKRRMSVYSMEEGGEVGRETPSAKHAERSTDEEENRCMLTYADVC
jgi:hypothetical protein